MTFPIELSHVSHRIARHFAVRDLSLRVPRGAVYGLLGPNGSGKTTTIRLILGMMRADEGTVILAGREMPDGASAALATVGYVPERLHLHPAFTVAQTLAFHRAFYPNWNADTSTQLLQEFGLREDQRVGSLSKGEAGKLMVLLALAPRPSVLILDEPTDGLDPVARRDVLAAVMAYVADCNATVLLTSHVVPEIERCCDWVGLLDQGALVAEQPMLAFRDSLRRLRVQGAPAVLGAMPGVLVARRSHARAEEWVVRGWGAEARHWLSTQGATVLNEQPLDLEETVVELLRAARTPVASGGR